jgi:4-hydroxybenzoate polyprenyltransferase
MMRTKTSRCHPEARISLGERRGVRRLLRAAQAACHVAGHLHRFVGLMLAPGQHAPVLGFVSRSCASPSAAGASGALNMWYDADIDAGDGPHAKAPDPAGKISPGEALAFGLTLSVGSVVTARPAGQLVRRRCWPSRFSSMPSSTRCG